MTMLDISGITHKYGSKIALNNVNTHIGVGTTAILGPNGAGKTTLINIIVGLLKPTEGTVLLNQNNIKEMGDKYYNYVGYLPQTPRFYSNYTAKQFLLYMALLKGIEKKYITARSDELLELVNLYSEKNNKIATFSGGMKQRLGIAQAMLNDPQLLILDEPTAGLDPNERIRFRNLISQISATRIVLLATHIVSDVECIAKRVILLNKGNLLFNQDPSQLTKSIEHKVWLVTVDTEYDVNQYTEKFSVSNIKKDENDKYELRIICESSPSRDARVSNPSLEDVFLYYFNEVSIGEQI